MSFVLEGRAVLAVLPVGHGAEEDAPFAERPPLDRGVERDVARGGLRVHLSPAPRVDRHVAVGAERLPRDARRPGATRPSRGERSVQGRGAPRARLGLERLPGRGRPGDELHDAAEGAGAVQVRGPAAQHLDALEGEPRHPRPVHPPAEGIVEREAVGEDEGTAGSARPEAPQGHPLGGGVGGAAARATEEREADDLPQRVVHRGGGRRVERRAGAGGRRSPAVSATRASPRVAVTVTCSASRAGGSSSPAPCAPAGRPRRARAAASAGAAARPVSGR